MIERLWGVLALALWAGSAGADDWQQRAEACVTRMQDPEQRAALEAREDFAAETARAETWTRWVYEELPERLAESEHPHDRLLLRWLLWADETLSSGLTDNPVAASSVDHRRSLALLDGLARSGSDDPLVLAAVVIACPAPGEDLQPGDYCGVSLEERFQNADPDNAYPWLQSAQRAWAADDLDRAFELLGRAAGTERMDWYFGRSQQVVMDRLRHHLGEDHELDADELALMAQTLGPQMVGYPGFIGLSQLCSAETVAGDNGRIEACVGAIEALARPGAALMDVKVAAGLARGLAPALVSTPQRGLEDWAAIQNRRVEELQTQLAGIGCLSLEQGPDAYQSLYGPAYLDDVVRMGEFRAQQALVERYLARQSATSE